MFPRRKGVSDRRRRQHGRSIAKRSFSNHPGLTAFAGEVLIVNPSVGLFQPRTQRGVRFPPEIFLNERVVAVTAVYPFGRAQVVASLELDTGKVLGQVDQLVDGNGFARAEVDRFDDLRRHDLVDPLYAVVDKHEAAGLIARTPDLDFVLSANLRFDDLAA